MRDKEGMDSRWNTSEMYFSRLQLIPVVGEEVNEERVKEIFAKNYKNHIAFGVLVSLVIGIYYYTIHAVKQETFLEEIDEEMAAEHPKTHGHLHVAEK
ncbi:hypothetical protein OESDEN_09551 [Oesophagostomum dentatum]|uniref:Cytochrome c oxidase assembly factor 3 n=1 Tax=Oesophagostomum dentatum TaxID=61180 RepID=A0A0B1T4A1_OESDE|nr:hypothetical protein OESDEN_09551 [Oesophagostomum dentatum]